MAYTSIDDPTQFFNTILYTGNDADNRGITGVNFAPNWVWIKKRNNAAGGVISDTVRGAGNVLYPSETNAEGSESASFVSFDSDGYTISQDAGVGLNVNSHTYVGWNWKAGGSAPAITYVVKVVSDSGNKYRFDDFGTSAVTLDLQEGGTYTFDQSDSSNSGHPLRFYTASDKSGGEYTTGVTTTGTAGSSGAKTVITVAASAPTLYYQCSSHSAMGGQVNTNSTFGSSNFSGSIQSTVSANTAAGFSISTFTSPSSGTFTFGHGLSSAPKLVILKRRNGTQNWIVGHDSAGWGYWIKLNTQDARLSNTSMWQNTAPSSSIVSLDSSQIGASNTFVAYCYSEKKGYSKFGKYEGASSTDGSFIYLGFKPAFFMARAIGRSESWYMFDNKRLGYNVENAQLYADATSSEAGTDYIDFLSNGVKYRYNSIGLNGSGEEYIYWAFAESPFVTSTGVPTTAR